MQEVADGATTFEGQNVTRSRTTVTLQSGGISASSSNSQYFMTSDRSFYKVVESTGTTYLPTSQSAVPDTVHVGDSGTIGTFNGSDGTTVTMTWRLDPGVNGASILAVSSVTKTGASVTSTEVDSYYLDTNGIPTSISVMVTASGTTISLTGNRV
jgi:hypothetical protein